MPYKILPLTTLDIRSAVQLYLSSFAHNAHSLACFPRSHTPSVRAWWEAMLGEEISEEGAVWLKAVTTTPPVGEGQGEGEMASFAKWVRVPPKPSLEEGGGGAPTTWPEGADERICKETFGVWAQRKREIMGARGHWYLEIIATLPKHQGKGIASQILRWGVEQADAEGVECYLEASPDAVGLYEKFGFREVGRTETWIESPEVDEGRGVWYVNLFMLRPALTGGRG